VKCYKYLTIIPNGYHEYTTGSMRTTRPKYQHPFGNFLNVSFNELETNAYFAMRALERRIFLQQQLSVQVDALPSRSGL
jgi:hypothetical protein